MLRKTALIVALLVAGHAQVQEVLTPKLIARVFRVGGGDWGWTCPDRTTS